MSSAAGRGGQSEDFERILRSEGLGERSLFDPHPHDSVTFVRVLPGDPEGSAHDAPVAVLWRALSAEVWALEWEDWPAKAIELLAAYCEHGVLLRAARDTGTPRVVARFYVRRFNRRARLRGIAQFPGGA